MKKWFRETSRKLAGRWQLNFYLKTYKTKQLKTNIIFVLKNKLKSSRIKSDGIRRICCNRIFCTPPPRVAKSWNFHILDKISWSIDWFLRQFIVFLIFHGFWYFSDLFKSWEILSSTKQKFFQNFEKMKSCVRVRGGIMQISKVSNHRTELNGCIKRRKNRQKIRKNHKK